MHRDEESVRVTGFERGKDDENNTQIIGGKYQQKVSRGERYEAPSMMLNEKVATN
jgi:hypothetical protein